MVPEVDRNKYIFRLLSDPEDGVRRHMLRKVLDRSLAPELEPYVLGVVQRLTGEAEALEDISVI